MENQDAAIDAQLFGEKEAGYRESAKAVYADLAPGTVLDICILRTQTGDLYSYRDAKKFLRERWPHAEILDAKAIIASNGKPWADNKQVCLCRDSRDVSRAMAFSKAKYHLTADDLKVLGVIDPAE